MKSDVSKILKTLFAATIPICNVLNLSAICLRGLKSICDNWIKRKIVPNVTDVWLNPTKPPPYHTNKPIVIDVEISAIGKKIELYQTVLSHAFLCLVFILTKFSLSIFSLLKTCISFIPEILSCTKELRLATSFLTSLNATFIALWNNLVAIKINGRIAKTINDNSMLKKIITPKTESINIKSATIMNNPWLKILAIVSMSLTDLVTNLPTDDLS